MTYMGIIAVSPLLFRIRKTALFLFGDWVSTAYNYEYFSEETLRMINDDIIVSDFTSCLSNAILHVLEKNDEKIKISEWAYGFVCGFMEGALHSRWYGRYIIQKSHEYKKATFFHSVYKICEIDQIVLDKIFVVYDYYLNQDGEDVQNIDYKVKHVISTNLNSDGGSREEFVASMKDESIKNFTILFNKRSDRNYSQKVENYLSKNEVEKLLAECGVFHAVGS